MNRVIIHMTRALQFASFAAALTLASLGLHFLIAGKLSVLNGQVLRRIERNGLFEAAKREQWESLWYQHMSSIRAIHEYREGGLLCFYTAAFFQLTGLALMIIPNNRKGKVGCSTHSGKQSDSTAPTQ